MPQQQKLNIPGLTNPLDFTINTDATARISNSSSPSTIEKFIKLTGSPNAYLHHYLDGTVAITRNCTWNGTNWIKDTNGVAATSIAFTNEPKIKIRNRLAANNAAWTDATWDSEIVLDSSTGGISSTQVANTMLMGPSSGSPAIPTFRVLTTNDLTSKMTMSYYLGTPLSNSTSGLATSLAANSVSNNFVGLVNPDVLRSVSVDFPSAWDGGNITITGTDTVGVQTEVVTSTPGQTIDTTKAFLTLTSITKSAVGASSQTCGIGRGRGLGLPTGRKRIVTNDGILQLNGSTSTYTLITSVAGGDPCVRPFTLPNGSRIYSFLAVVL